MPGPPRKLKWYLKLSYGLGHIKNDLCASMWFTYLLVFFNKILIFDNTSAGIVLLIGQIADGISTPLVGILSDSRDENCVLCRKWGNKRAWHLVGSICTSISFPFIFQEVPGGGKSDLWAQIFYYGVLVVIFQFGWAAVQISHLSLIPEITPLRIERMGLTAIRYAATVASNITVSCITWIFLGISGDETALNPSHKNAFLKIVITVLAIGILASSLFHALMTPHFSISSSDPQDLVPEEETQQEEEEVEEEDEEEERHEKTPMTKKDWFFEPQFYLVAGLYMFTRLFVNLTQAYIPFYLSETLRVPAVSIAIIPLVMFVSGFFISLVMKCMDRLIGWKILYLLGCVVGVMGCAFIRFDGGMTPYPLFLRFGIYGVAILIGAGASILLITSLSVTSELIGPNSESGAFIFGIMSLTDKISNGIAVLIIQTNVPNINDCVGCREYYRTIIFYVGGGAAVFGGLVLLILTPFKLGERRKNVSVVDPPLLNE